MISPEKWGVMKVSKHHYALELARRGNQVYFINPPQSGKIDKEQINENLFILNVPHYPMINRLGLSVRNFFHKGLVKRIHKLTGVERFDIVWSFNPFVLQNLKSFKAGLTIYHPVDLHLSELDMETAKQADVLFCTSNAILERYNSIEIPAFQINHGLRQEFVNPDQDCTCLNLDRSTVNICYVGNLQYRFLNFEILTRIVEENPNVNFYFIGPETKSNFGEFKQFDYSNLKSRDNTYFMGAIESDKIATILGCFDGFITSYSAENPVYISNLHKTLEFLSTGKVIISSYSSQYKDKSELIEMVEAIEDLPQRFKEVINNLDFYNSEEKRIARIDYARNNTYGDQINRIEIIITDLNF